MIRNSMIYVIRVAFIILWVYAGVSKLIDYTNFKFQLGRSPYIEHLAGFVAIALPLVEIGVAILLVFDKVKIYGFYASFFMMLLFTGYIYAMLNYSYFIPCSCGGILSRLDWHSHLVFNVIFTLLGLAGILLTAISRKQAFHLKPGIH